MDTPKGAQGSEATPVENVQKSDGVMSAAVINPPASAAAMPVVEVRDEDYRSFCWPCYALEDDSDCAAREHHPDAQSQGRRLFLRSDRVDVIQGLAVFGE